MIVDYHSDSKKNDDFLTDFLTLALIGIVVFGLFFIAGRAIDSSFDNKDEMLCNSAKVSGNEVYLEKCICYYAGENIRCIYKEGK